MEPALAALVLRPAVPGDTERLHPTVREGDQILLQRVDAEGVADLEVGELAVRPVGIDEELVVPFEEAGGDVAVREPHVVEVAEDSLVRRLLHGEVVVRAAPSAGLRLVTGRAACGTDEGRRHSGRGRLGAAEPASNEGQDESAEREHRPPGDRVEGSRPRQHDL